MLWKIIGVLAIINLIFQVEATEPIVETVYGKIRGNILNGVNNDTFFAFQGIPFAKPPLGKLRLQPPQRPDSWEGILDDRNAYKQCIPMNLIVTPNQTEDCLYLNVYTRQLPSKDQNVSLPVVVYIHGGAFVFGSAQIESYGPHFLIERDVILVTIQYRLGFFGFLSTGDLVCPGNNGFKDQQFAIRWVQENIHSFGGDPKRVTIFGQSAGAASVGYQLLGSNSTGLFRAAIQDSGSSLGSWTLQSNPRKFAYEFGNHINHNINETNTTSEELIEYFRTLDISTIVNAYADIFGVGMIGGFYKTLSGKLFAGVIEPEHDGAFLTESAFNRFQSGNFNVVPLLIGVNTEEALFLAFDSKLHERMIIYDKYPELIVPPDFHLSDVNITRPIGEDIRKIYVGSGRFQDNLGPSIEYFSDSAFCRPSIKQAELESHYTNVYFYEFAYSGKKSQFPLPNIPGAGKVFHGAELTYILSRKDTTDLSKWDKEDLVTLKRMVTLWTNFIKYLNPTPEPSELLQNITWPSLSPTSDMTYLLINDTLQVKYNLKKPMVDEYNRLYDTYAIPPLVTY
ncbi:hypothetical protein HHI36_016199 [Cryptolaemus montrouzieri]|uniref:Carboxylic ester hydrolase n=1 Tax=Cryptolaemus montrouzieri TaxID=559131 RepID=A0ABD2NJ11_9CUCU